ncbi:MAG TPA: hypothetical protein VMT61_00455 [Candidatus Binataceae bacterium]|nr:hypothetical protein [Candidatus Binataceae bacterium]
MPVTGQDVWEVGLKMGWARGPFDPSKNPTAARAVVMATSLNEVLQQRGAWLPDLSETEDAMRLWEERTPREYVLRLYKFLNQIGYTVNGIDAAIERERKKRKPSEPKSF